MGRYEVGRIGASQAGVGDDTLISDHPLRSQGWDQVILLRPEVAHQVGERAEITSTQTFR